MPQHQHVGWVEKEAKRNYIPRSERAGEGASIIGTVLVALFFYAHQAWDTGFFTPAFGNFESFFLYGSIILGAAGPVPRSATGSKNSARIPEIFAGAFWILSSSFLLISFPFDFARFGDVIPEFLHFLTGWLTNEIGWILLLIGSIGGLVFVTMTIYLYFKVNNLLRLKQSPPQESSSRETL
jgi:hypothetical protein